MDAFTLGAWVFPSRSGADFPVITKVNPSRDFQLGLWEVAPHRARWLFWTDEVYDVGSGRVVPPEAWTHIAGLWDGDEMRIYVNGRLAGSRHWQGVEPAWTGWKMEIGAMNTQEFFQGRIDDVRIYDRALSDGQIWALYHLDSPGETLAGP